MENSLVEKYKQLLNEDREEQDYQDFLEAHTQFIPRHFMRNHGVHMNLVLRKVKISNDMVADFLILSKSTICWHYILIEIEKPTTPYFESGGFNFHLDFLNALKKIKTWQKWFAEPANKSHFEAKFKFIKKPISDTPVEIKYVLVTGKQKEFEHSQIRTRAIRDIESNDLHVMSFDSLAEDAASNEELYLGSRQDSSVEVLSNKLLTTTFLDLCHAHDFILNRDIKKLILNHLNRKQDKFSNTSVLDDFGKARLDKLINKVERMKVANEMTSAMSD